ncbi:RNA-binding cell elongation regulator Jag/EloR [Lacticaseibacillus jixianensis]|uniref:RNA-binding protein KhpB n=1 Tax=Lacticaseibacillus jixianensis TaxID=2486012 RepID=A0ABW4B936_9LACO|nr:RNA-binding cell elongation regulator Jag/EloR [Lacticaseibacillus jixianensis]
MPTFQGATIQKAIDAGLKAMKQDRAAVSVEVVQEGKKGLLGIGRKPAIVNLQLNPEPSAEPKKASATKVHHLPSLPKPKLPEALRRDQPVRDDQTAIALVQSYLEDITTQLQIPTTIDSERRGDTVWFALTTEKDALLIGKHGKIINAIQYLAQTEFNHYGKSKCTVMLNVGDYRERRDAAVRRLADKTAREVIARGTAVYLDPMPTFERKAIHQALADNEYVETHSEGLDPRRYVVITPKRRTF